MNDRNPDETAFGTVDPSAIQPAVAQRVQAKVGQPFVVEIENSKLGDDPGSSWFVGFDDAFLSQLQSGWHVSYESTSVTWALFMPKQPGTTIIQGVRQPHLINPLYIQNDFEVVITS